MSGTRLFRAIVFGSVVAVVLAALSARPSGVIVSDPNIWDPLVTETAGWHEADSALRRKLAVLITAPVAGLLLGCWLLSALRSRGHGSIDEEREAAVRLDANAGSLGALVRSEEVIVRSVSRHAGILQPWLLKWGGLLPSFLIPFWLHKRRINLAPHADGASLRAFLARPRTFDTLPQLLVGLLPIPLVATTVHAACAVAISAVCCGGYPPAEWLCFESGSSVFNYRGSSYVIAGGAPVVVSPVSLYTAAVAASFVIVRILWPGGRANVAISATWFFLPVTFNLGGALFGFGAYDIFNLRSWFQYATFLWPGFYSLHWFFLALFAVDAFIYYGVQRHHLFVTDGRLTSVLTGHLYDRRWTVVTTLSEPPPVVSFVTRPFGADLSLRFGTSDLGYAVTGERQGRDMLTAMGVTSIPCARRRFFLVELLTRCGWIIAIYAWLAWAYVNVVDAHLRKGALAARVVNATSGYDVAPVASALRRETDFVLSVDPDHDLANYFRARLLETDGKSAEAEVIYRQLIARSHRKSLEEIRAESPPFWLLVTGQKIRNASNERLLKLGELRREPTAR